MLENGTYSTLTTMSILFPVAPQFRRSTTGSQTNVLRKLVYFYLNRVLYTDERFLGQPSPFPLKKKNSGCALESHATRARVCVCILANPYMDIALTFHFGEVEKPTYWWDMREICPTRPDANYLKKLPYSSCVDDDVSKAGSEDTDLDLAYNVYVFSDRYSNTLEILDDKG